MKRLAETGLRSRNVTEVQKRNPVFEFAQESKNIFAHRTERRLAERNRMRGTVNQPHRTAVRIGGDENARIPEQTRDRRIIGMKSHPDTRLLRRGNDRADEILVVFPELFR